MNSITSRLGRLSRPAILALLFCCFAGSASYAAEDVAFRDLQSLKSSFLDARQSGKNLMVVFGAEWCDRCALLNKFMSESVLKEKITNSFEVVYIDLVSSGIDAVEIQGEENLGSTESNEAESLPAIIVIESTQPFEELLFSSELMTFLPDRNLPIYDWLSSVLLYTEDTLVYR